MHRRRVLLLLLLVQPIRDWLSIPWGLSTVKHSSISSVMYIDLPPFHAYLVIHNPSLPSHHLIINCLSSSSFSSSSSQLFPLPCLSYMSSSPFFIHLSSPILIIVNCETLLS
ncbi:hypothetical protein QBC43DRAFT_327331 [Cladorrhinum sp. PSN259]|nr:hypothetical protein QBC43DRAFT_327331 [Cladorrhinum sp. PSN259]